MIHAVLVGAFLARVCLTAAVSTEPSAPASLDVPVAMKAPALDLAADVGPADDPAAARVRLESGAVELGVDVAGPRRSQARVELAVSTRVAAFSVRF